MAHETSLMAQRQRPLRAHYREEPSAAITTKQVRTVDAAATDPVHGAVEAVGAFPTSHWAFGIDRKIGGDGDLPNPGHLLCAALAACEDSTIRMVADHLGVEVSTLEVTVVGEVDCRGCLAMDATVPVGFRSLDVRVCLKVAPGTDPRREQQLRDAADQLCVNLDTLRRGIPVSVSYEHPPARSATAPARPPRTLT